MQIQIGCPVFYGHVLTTTFAQRLFLTMTTSIFDHLSLIERYPIIAAASIGTVKRLPIHFILLNEAVLLHRECNRLVESGNSSRKLRDITKPPSNNSKPNSWLLLNITIELWLNFLNGLIKVRLSLPNCNTTSAAMYALNMPWVHAFTPSRLCRLTISMNFVIISEN